MGFRIMELENFLLWPQGNPSIWEQNRYLKKNKTKQNQKQKKPTKQKKTPKPPPNKQTIQNLFQQEQFLN